MKPRRRFAPLASLIALILLAAWTGLARREPPSAQPPVASNATQRPASTPTASPTPLVYIVAPATAAPTSTPSPRVRAISAIVARSAPPASPTAEPLATLPPQATVPPPAISNADAPPRIIALTLDSPVVRSGQVARGSVETSTNVASVEARIGGYAVNLQKAGVGRFTLAYRVPRVPFFLHRSYTVELIARNTRGDAVTTTFPIELR